MPLRPVLHDAVTLRHFASAQALDVLELVHGNLPEPRVAEAVFNEIRRAADAGETHCSIILLETWLGTLAVCSPNEMMDVIDIQNGLNSGPHPPEENLGEAVSIFLAEEHDGIFATDDDTAYEYAAQRWQLGPARVIDTVDILRKAVSVSSITKQDAASIAVSIVDADRWLRPVHDDEICPDYF